MSASTQSKRTAAVILAAVLFAFVATGPAVALPQGGTGWNADAKAYRGRLGARYVYTCPARASYSTVWGTDVYSDDSSVCTAAVHAGRITFARGGTVTIEMRAGLRSYRATTRNGVTTRGWGSWSGSFVIIGAISGQPATTVAPGAATTTTSAVSSQAGWGAAAQNLRSHVGSRYSYTCPPGGPARTAWGTDVYTDDSSVCTAAVHAGLIGIGNGGTVTIEIRPGQASYTGSSRNGITSGSYGTWGGSYVFTVNGVPTVTTTTLPAGVELGGDGWGAAAQNLRSHVGSRYRYTCPPGGPARTAWGTDVYTDDSSVCTAAVHAGRITEASGGAVIIEVRAGQASYTGSVRNGITSGSYGAWGGSYVFVS